MAKTNKQLFKVVPNVGYSILGGKKYSETLGWVEYRSENELDKISGMKAPKGFRYVYVIDVTDWGEEKKSSFVRWNIGETGNNVFDRYELKTGWRYRVIRVFLSRLTDYEIRDKIRETEELSCVKFPSDNDPTKSKEFVDVCAAALAESGVSLKKTEALNYLADVNLITQRRYKDIETATRKASQIRARKE